MSNTFISCRVFILSFVATALLLPVFSASTFGGYATPGNYEPPPGYFPTGFTKVDFDSYPDGNAVPNNTNISNQYRPLGVVFTPASGAPASQFMRASVWGTDYISPPNALVADHGSSSWGTPIKISVTFPEEMFVSMPTKVGLVFTDSCYNNPFTVKAFDSANHEVDSITINTADNDWKSPNHTEDTFCGVEYAGGIYRIDFGTAKKQDLYITGMEVDNLYHNGLLVPEPATLLLFVLGGLGLIRRKR